ncbi:AsmA family protein [Neolewinella antarctica]|uniref:AsmA family protein n=1 Tax=Neolewinella antarctica TaxID=442734 RepID=A0ABX0X785_9BACT|nr:AsmA family protein [Neolewinella antarctica]NJC25095.1 hypothetical protein [Neolewinella antarctica]
MKVIKRIVIVLVVLIVLVIGALIAAPILFKDQIVDNVRTSVNKMVDAEVDFRDIDVSFLRSFPEVSVQVHDVRVIGIDTFAGLPLMRAKEVVVDLGFWSVVGSDGNYNIEAVTMTEPDINLVVISPELANYLIVPETEAAQPSDPAPATAQINLEHYEIKNGSFVYDDRTTDTYIKIKGLHTTGDGDFTSTLFDLDTYSEIEALTLSQGGVTYLNKVKATADAIVGVDLDNQRYTFKENVIKLNALDLNFDGTIELAANDDILFDLTYNAPANDFRQLWSMIPATYVEGFEDVKTTGTFTLNGTVKGAFNSVTETYPAFTVKTDIASGSVQYPGRPVGITGIDAAVAINSPSSDLNQLKVNVPRFNFNLGGDPFSGSFRLATPLSDPDIDATLKGTIDLDKWAKAIPLDGVTELGGRIIADVAMQNVRQSVLDAGNYADVSMTGNMSIADLIYVADDLPPVRITNATADFTPQAINIRGFDAKLGRSDLSGSGSITTPLAYFSPEQTMRGKINILSNFFDADEWMAEETGSTVSPAEMDAAGVVPPTAETAIFDRFDFDIDADIKQLSYGTYQPKNLRAVGNIKPNRLDIEVAEATLGSSSFSASGNVKNLFDYTFDNGILGGDITVRSPFIDLADFMTEEPTAVESSTTTTATTAESAAIPIPDNIQLNVNLLADRVKYDDIDLTNAAGKLLVRGGQAVIEDGRANLLGGAMDFAGAYDTSEPGDPGFRFHYDMKSIDFTQAFNKLNSFAALAPIGKFIRGNFSTDLVLEGKLGDDLFPKMNSLNAQGLFQTFNAQLTGIEPLRKIGQALNVKELTNSTTLSDIMTVFKIQDGTVAVEPFDLNIAGIPMTLAGRHGLDSDMDYNIKAAIPRSMIEGNALAGAALSALDKLGGQAAKLGLNISPGDILNVGIGLTGNFANPKTSFKLLGTDGGEPASAQDALVGAVKDQAKAEVDKQVNLVKDRAQAQLDSLKGIANVRSQAIQDSIRTVANLQAAKLQQLAQDQLKGQLDSLRLDSIAKSLLGGDPADRIKKELGKFNPFKKN